MIASILAVLSWKMVAYVATLLILTARIGHWKKRDTEARLSALELEKELRAAQDSLLSISAQVSDWQTKANASAAKAQAAASDAAAIRAEYEEKVNAILSTDVTDPMKFLRQGASK